MTSTVDHPISESQARDIKAGDTMPKEGILEFEPNEGQTVTADGEILVDGQLLNVTGHVQEVKRNYGLFGLCAIAVVIGDCWAVQGGSVVSFLDLPFEPTPHTG